MPRIRAALAQALLVIFFAACGHGAPTNVVPASLSAPLAAPDGGINHHFEHVVIIIQENRSVDDLFHGFDGADWVGYGRRSNGARVPLEPISLSARYDISHRHDAFEIEYDRGKLDGFDLVHSHCPLRKFCPIKGKRAYAYVPKSEVQPYWTMAREYGFANRMFQTNQGPSFPAHQYLLSGTSSIKQNSPLLAAENPLTTGQQFTGGCDSPPGSSVYVIDPLGKERKRVYPCFDRLTMTDLLDEKAISWRYYVQRRGPGLWNAPDAIRPLRKSGEYRTHVIDPPSAVLRNIADGQLPAVSWVTPTPKSSDHAGQTDGSGPDWVASVVNAVGESSYWNNTAIFVTWDDWGGWYDHVPPPMYNSYELGFRVPLIVISRYTPKGFISHRRHEFGSILKFVETNFYLGSLGATDQRADDLEAFFDYNMAPRRFKPIPTRLPPAYFLNADGGSGPPDTDF